MQASLFKQYLVHLLVQAFATANTTASYLNKATQSKNSMQASRAMQAVHDMSNLTTANKEGRTNYSRLQQKQGEQERYSVWPLKYSKQLIVADRLLQITASKQLLQITTKARRARTILSFAT